MNVCTHTCECKKIILIVLHVDYSDVTQSYQRNPLTLI